MWVLQRLKNLNCPRKELIEVLKQQIFSVVEQAVPYWGPHITKAESQAIERVLKTGLHIILQKDYKSFRHALAITKLQSLSQRRKNLIFRFAKKCEASSKFSKWFSKESMTKLKKTRQKGPKYKYKSIQCRTTKFERSSLPILTKALAWHPPLIYVAPNIK